MGFLNKKTGHTGNTGLLRRLPTGSFTVDSQGRVVSSTVPQSVDRALVEEIGQNVVTIFQGARKANVSFSELVAQYAAFKITAREMRGGAIIFFSPKSPQWMSSSY